MQKWEYRTATLAPSGWGKARKWQLRQIDEQELYDWQFTEGFPSLVIFCNQMGFEGWELVCVTDAYSGASADRFLYFKRPHLGETS